MVGREGFQTLHRHLGHLLFQCILDEGIQRLACLAGKHGNLTMDGGRKAHVQHARIAFVGLYALFLAIGQIVVHSLVEGLGKLLHALAFEIHQPVDAFNLAEEHLILSLKATEPR